MENVSSASADNRPKPFVFVLMPFDKAFDDIYQLGIKQACAEAGAYCERVDEQIFQGSILQRIYNQIAKADIVVSDMTGRNPNVFYETGYAHALGKTVILLTQNADDIPFDLKHYSHIVYGTRIIDLQKELQPRIQWYVQNPSLRPLSGPDALIFYMNGQKLDNEKPLVIPVKHLPVPIANMSSIGFELTILIHNPAPIFLSEMAAELFVDVPQAIRRAKPVYPIMNLPNSRTLIGLGSIDDIMPEGWRQFEVQLRVSLFPESKVYPCMVKFYSAVRVRELPFVIETTPTEKEE